MSLFIAEDAMLQTMYDAQYGMLAEDVMLAWEGLHCDVMALCPNFEEDLYDDAIGAITGGGWCGGYCFTLQE